MTKSKKVVKAWVIINGQNEVTNKQAEHFQCYVYREEKPAQYQSWLWNKQVGEKRYKAVGCTITYSLTPKKK